MTALIVMVAAYFTMPIMAAGFADTSLWKVFIPAALCGFWSLGDRSALAAFWFPVAALDALDPRSHRRHARARTGRASSCSAGSPCCSSCSCTRASRGASGLWCAVSAAPLARAKPLALLKEAPGRPLARAGWGVLVSAITVAITAWVAPQLWHVEPLRGDEIQIADPTPIDGLPCCPLVRNAETSRSRVKEYLDLGFGHDDGAIPSDERNGCRACDQATMTRTAYGLGESRGVGGPMASAVTDDDGAAGVSDYGSMARPGTVVRVAAPEPVAPEPAPATEPAPAIPDQVPAPATQPIEATPPPPPAPPPPPVPVRAATPEAPRLADRAPGWASAPRAPQRSTGPSILPWLVMLATAALVFQLVGLALRPVRRLVTLRHLRRPFWDETIDQRVSNSWQLALIGLRDAGWRPESGEPPRELAARVGIEGVERCATILERARHGVGIDAGDVSDMRAAADAAYRSARGRLGAFARVIGWLRWPLT